MTLLVGRQEGHLACKNLGVAGFIQSWNLRVTLSRPGKSWNQA